MMFNIVLYEPEIPSNTGNIIRLCANTGCMLHLIKPLGFTLDDKKLRRAGLDYHEWADVVVHESYEAFLQQVNDFMTIFAVSTKGSVCYSNMCFKSDSWLLFGPETRGLPHHIIESLSSNQVLNIPMVNGSRSLNLSNAVAVVTYEAWRQNNFVSQ